MNKKLIKVVIPVLIVIEFSFIFLTFMSYQNKDITSIKETSKVDKERFAMYVENMEGEYEKVSDLEFNGRYLLNQEKTICVDNKGVELENVITYNNNQVTVTSNKTLFCYLYFDLKIDIQVDVETDGEASKVPTTLGYTKSITCEDGTTPTWNYKYNRLEFTGLSSDETKCKLTYTKDANNYETLVNTVENADNIYHETYAMREFDKGTVLTESEYNVLEKYYSSGASDSVSYGTEITNELAFADGKWKFQTDNLIEKYYYLKLGVNEPGNYQLCYELSSGDSLNTIRYISFNGKNIALNGTYTNLSASSDQNKSGCFDLGYLTSEDYVKTVFDPYTSTSGETSDYNIYLQKAHMLDQYRYNGQNPDNYLWFNNEMWRIIGSIPTKVSEDGTSSNLIKIIRNDALGYYMMNAQSFNAPAYQNSTLNQLLNDYYYNSLDGSSSGYCYSYITWESFEKCDYSNMGLNKSFYKNMIENAYWNWGSSSIEKSAFDIFYDEGSDTTNQSYVGIMNAGDYAYAATKDYYNTSINSYGTLDITGSNWLYKYEDELVGTQSGNYEISLYNGNAGTTGSSSVSPHGYVRPVVYLKSNVYVTTGDGTEANPYQIAMK